MRAVHLSDTQIRASLRSVMAKHRLDLNKTSFSCTRGTVRILGELKHQGAYASTPVHQAELEALEYDVTHTRGVVRVYFDLSNWRRLESGEWQPTEESRSPVLRRAEAQGSALDI